MSANPEGDISGRSKNKIRFQCEVAGSRRTSAFGLLNRKPRWGLSLHGWIAALCTLAMIVGLLTFTIHPFLAASNKVAADTLVVEGWIHDFAVRETVREFNQGSYRQVLTTGGPVPGSGGYINDFNTMASVCADLLKKNGLPMEVVQVVPSRVMDRNRTFGAAVALRNWLAKHRPDIRSFNVITEDAHARRTLLLFRKAFAQQNIAIGVISIPSPDYDARRWWRYSEGVRESLGETVAYLYARLFFWPSEDEVQGRPTTTKPAE